MFNKINYILTILLVTSCSYKPLIELDFNNDTLNLYERQLVGHKRIELDKKNGVNNSPAIKVYYEGYEMGSKTVMRLIKIPIELEEATLNYSVKFSDSFNFVLGGKLHGFVPQNKIVGGKKMQANGWSARANFKKNGGVASYLYHQNKSYKYGDGISSKQTVFKKGQYHSVSIYLKLNSPAESKNGKFEIWVDGNLIIKHEDVQFRLVDDKDSLISHFYFSTFHGGSKKKFAPIDKNGNFTTETAWFDNISVYEGKFVRFNKGKK